MFRCFTCELPRRCRPGIYSGKVKRDEQGNVVWGKQYQNHNKAPGPVYGAYSPRASVRCARPQGNLSWPRRSDLARQRCLLARPEQLSPSTGTAHLPAAIIVAFPDELNLAWGSLPSPLRVVNPQLPPPRPLPQCLE